MMQWFGQSWRAPINDALTKTPIPVGEKCRYCDELITRRDSGVMMTQVDRAPEGSGEPWVAHRTPLHRECFLRESIGSVGHIKGKCSCFGGSEADPPGMTRRQAAKAAVRLYTRLHG